MLIQIILVVLIFLAAIIAGKILRKSTREELKAGRRWFIAIIATSLFIAAIVIFLPIEIKLKLSYVITLLIISLISYISFRK
jgi:uncharacterized membrane protein YoaT (DUF817 family)